MTHPHLTPQAEGEIDKILRHIRPVIYEDQPKLLKESVDTAKAALARLLLRERADELMQLQKYWTDLSMVVPRLQASPPQVKQHIVERLAQLQPNRGGIMSDKEPTELDIVVSDLQKRIYEVGSSNVEDHHVHLEGLLKVARAVQTDLEKLSDRLHDLENNSHRGR
jgi:hypothetical protein